MALVTLEIARKHCRSDEYDDDVLAVYLSAAEQSVADYLNRQVYATQEELNGDERGIIVNGVIVAAILLICGHLYANREEVLSGVTVTQLPVGARELLRPHRLIQGV